MPGEGKDQTRHNARAFAFRLAGGGVKAGFTHGRRSDNGAECIEGKVHFRDLHATILHLLGLDHDRLVFTQGGKVVRDVLA